MKFPVGPISLASLIVAIILAWPVLRNPHFPSQNAIYHAAMASLSAKESPLQSSPAFLPHRDHPELWSDQHRGFHESLAILQKGLPPLQSVQWLNVLGLLFVAFAFLQALNSNNQDSPDSPGRTFFYSLFALSILFLHPDFLLRLSVGRPAAWSLGFFLLIFSRLRRFRGGKDYGILTLLFFLWSSFSYFAMLSLLLVTVLGPTGATSSSLLRSKIKLAALACLAILSGFLWSSGLSLFHHLPLLLASYPLAQSGVYEWSSPADLSFFLPLVLCLLGLFLKRNEPPEPLRKNVLLISVLFLALVFSLLTLRQQRWLEFAWPLTLLSVLPALTNLKVSLPRRKFHLPSLLARSGLLITALVALLVLIGVTAGRIPNDKTLDPATLPLLSEVNSRLPQTPLLSLEWTLFSSALFLDPQTQMEPGFSLALYQERDRGQFLNDYFLVTQSRTPRDAYERLSRLLRSLGARHVLFKQSQLPIHPYRPPAWMKVLYISGPWVLAEIDVEPKATPEQMRASFTISPEDLTQRLASLCSLNPIAVQPLPTARLLTLTQSLTLPQSLPGSFILLPWASASPARPTSEIIKTCVSELAQHLKNSDLILWYDPQPVASLESFAGEAVRGFFSLVELSKTPPHAPTYRLLADFPNSDGPESPASSDSISTGSESPGLKSTTSTPSLQNALTPTPDWRRARRTVLALARESNGTNSQILRRGRFAQITQPRGTDLCWAYQAAARAVLRHQEEIFRAWKDGPADIDSLRAEIALDSLCQRPELIPSQIKSEWLNTCLRFQEGLKKGPAIPSTQWSRRLVSDMTLLKMGQPSRLSQFQPKEIWDHGIFTAKIATDFVPPGHRIYGDGNLPLFTSGHLALWWTQTWFANQKQGIQPKSEDLNQFLLFAKDSYHWWKGPFNHNLFLTRWWGEALVNALSLGEEKQNPFLSEWLKEFFLATETYINGPREEPLPGCLGPQVPGLGPLPFPNHNAAVVWEGLEQARRLDLSWWNSEHETTLQGLMSCTLSLQKQWPYWPQSEEGEFALSPGLGEFHPDVQAHAMNAMATRIKNDGIHCDN